MVNLKPNEEFARVFQLDIPHFADGKIPETLPLSFSSEKEVDRGEYIEVLLHNDENVDLEYLRKAGKFLNEHDEYDVLGRMENVYLKNKRGYGDVRFSKRSHVQEIIPDIIDKIRDTVSCRYQILDYKIQNKDGKNYLYATRWRPIEVTLASIPADDTVGFFRSKVAKVDGKFNKINFNIGEKKKMDEKRNIDIQLEAHRKAEEAKIQAELQKKQAEFEAKLENERKLRTEADAKRVTDIRQASKNYKNFKLKNNEIVEDVASHFIAENKSVEDFYRYISENMLPGVHIEQKSDLGMDTKDINKFSYFKFARALAFSDWREAGFEKEVIDNTRKVQNKTYDVYPLPSEMFQKRFLGSAAPTSSSSSAGYITEASGSHLINTEKLFGNFIEYVYDELVLTELGANMMTGLVGNIEIPKQKAEGDYTWGHQSNNAKSETHYQNVISSLPQFETISMTPHMLISNYQMSKSQLLQSAISMEEFTKRGMARNHSLAGQKAVIYGGTAKGDTGSPYGIPYRLIQASRNAIVPVNTHPSNDCALTWLDIVKLQTSVKRRGKQAYLTSTNGECLLKTTAKVANQDVFLMNENYIVNGRKCAITDTIDDTWTANSKSNNTLLIFGNWDSLMIGFWGGIDFLVDPYTYSKLGGYNFVMTQYMDNNIAREEDFGYIEEWSA